MLTLCGTAAKRPGEAFRVQGLCCMCVFVCLWVGGSDVPLAP